MRFDELISDAERQLRICNACRYCEGYCAVWHAIEWRREFDSEDVFYLANLCHDCRDCYHACPYAEPHEFAVNPPKVFSGVREEVYQKYAWPRGLGKLLHRQWAALVAGVDGALFFLFIALTYGSGLLHQDTQSGSFYRLIPEMLMNTLFTLLGLWVFVAWIMAGRSFWKDIGRKDARKVALHEILQAIGYAVTLRYLGGDDTYCSDKSMESSAPRRWFHHLVFYGFLCDFASTTLAAFYTHVLGIQAPYPWTSPVVILGALGGIGIIVGGIGLLYLRTRNMYPTSDREAGKSGTSFILSLVIVAFTGMLVLLLRRTSLMGIALVVHLGSVVALFVTAPYSKFIHFVFRLIALVRYVREENFISFNPKR